VEISLRLQSVFENQRDPASIPSRDRTLDLSSIQQVHPLQNPSLVSDMLKMTVSRQGLAPSKDEGALAAQMQKNASQTALDNFFDGEYFKKTPAGKLKAEVEKATQQQVTFAPTPAGIQQKLGMNFKLIERTAAVNYEGYFKSQLFYGMDANQLIFSVTKPLDPTTEVGVKNTATSFDFGGAVSQLVLTHSF
jgi:hypothetical protein